MDIPSLRHPCSSHTGQKTRHLWNHSTTAQISHSCQWNWLRRGHNSQTVAARARQCRAGDVDRCRVTIVTAADDDVPRKARGLLWLGWRHQAGVAAAVPRGAVNTGLYGGAGCRQGLYETLNKEPLYTALSQPILLSRCRNGRPFMWLPYLACENLYGVVESSVIRICDSGSAHCMFLRYSI